jgi:hypothetical protein
MTGRAAAGGAPACRTGSGGGAGSGDPHRSQKTAFISEIFVPQPGHIFSFFSGTGGGNLFPHLLQKTAWSSGSFVPHFGQNWTIYVLSWYLFPDNH